MITPHISSWIKGENTMENVLRFLVWYGPVLVIVLGLSGLLVYLRVYIKRQVREIIPGGPERDR